MRPLMPGVIAPKKAWRILQGESPCREGDPQWSSVRVSHPPVSSLGSMAELLRSLSSEQDGLSVGRESCRPQGRPRSLKCWYSFEMAIADAVGFNVRRRQHRSINIWRYIKLLAAVSQSRNEMPSLKTVASNTIRIARLKLLFIAVKVVKNQNRDKGQVLHTRCENTRDDPLFRLPGSGAIETETLGVSAMLNGRRTWKISMQKFFAHKYLLIMGD